MTTEITGVIQMIWSEKLARDVYTTLGADYASSRIFEYRSHRTKTYDRLIAMLINHS